MEQETQLCSPGVFIKCLLCAQWCDRPWGGGTGRKGRALNQELPDHPVIFEAEITKEVVRLLEELEIRDRLELGQGDSLSSYTATESWG